MGSNYTTSNENFGCGTVGISISELKGIRLSAISLKKEMETQTPNSVSMAEFVANQASRVYDGRVSSQARAVLTQCDKLSAEYSEAHKELESMVNGIDSVINSFQALEQDMVVNTSGFDSYKGGNRPAIS